MGQRYYHHEVCFFRKKMKNIVDNTRWVVIPQKKNLGIFAFFLEKYVERADFPNIFLQWYIILTNCIFVKYERVSLCV